MGQRVGIRTSTTLALLVLSAASCLACAKGQEIDPAEVVLLQLLPPGADAGADAGEPAPDESAPVGIDPEL